MSAPPYPALLFALFACMVAIPALAQEGGGPALIILDVTEDSRAVTFEDPLESEDPVLHGKSIDQLSNGQPLFPPIEGLPASVWEDQKCSGCHNWTRETLCEQGQFYLSEAGKVGLAKIHPYGGGFKQVLRTWSAQGCN